MILEMTITTPAATSTLSRTRMSQARASSTTPGINAMKALAIAGGTWAGIRMTRLRSTKKR